MTRVYKAPVNSYTVDGDVIRVAPGSKLNKVSGTSLGGILEVSPFNTPFQVACALLNVCREDISDKPAVKVGQALETEIIKYAEKTYPQYGLFMPAEQVYVKREGDHDSWVSDFEDETFAGHVDGIVMSDDGDYILEIKTSSNMDSWTRGVPIYYKLQVGLYNHFITKKDKAYVVLGVVNENTYKDYHSWIPNENTVAMFEFDIDQETFAKTLDRVREWYQKYILNGVTPPYDPTNPGDVEMYEHLVGLSKDVEEVKDMVQQYRDLTYEIDSIESEHKDKYDAREALKAQIKDYMEAHQLKNIESKDGAGQAMITTTTRSAWDEDAMVKDGIDVSKYKVKKQIKAFKFKD